VSHSIVVAREWTTKYQLRIYDPCERKHQRNPDISCTQEPVMLASSSYLSLLVSCRPRSRQADHKNGHLFDIQPASQQQPSQAKTSFLYPCLNGSYLSKVHEAQCWRPLAYMYSLPCKSTRSSITAHLSLALTVGGQVDVHVQRESSERQVDTTVSQSLLQAEAGMKHGLVITNRCT